MLLSYLKNGRIVRENFDAHFDKVCDICVVGMGTAGAIAVIAAAKEGMNVIGVEKMSAMGGMGTLACVWDYYYGSKGGLFESIDGKCFKLAEEENYLPVENPENGYKNCINGTLKQRLLEEEAISSGCTLMYGATLSGVFVSDNRVIGVEIFRDGKFIRIKSDVVIDSTGNALVCRYLGCEFNPGRRFDNVYMKVSLPKIQLINGLARGTWSMCGRIDGVDSHNTTNAIKNGLALYPQSFDKNNRILFNGSLLGVRESPTIVSRENFTLSDYIAGKKPKNPLFYACGPLDNTNHDVAFENEETENYKILCNLIDYAFSVGVTREMMMPKGYDGILTACRAIGVGHDLAGMLRMKRDMQKMGEAAAVLAAYSVKQKESLSGTDLSPVLKRLTESGCLDKKNDMGISLAEKQYKYTSVSLPEKNEEYKTVFESDAPGLGIWAYYISPPEKRDTAFMKALLNSDEKMLRFASATALGLCKDRAAIPVLREMLADTSPMSLIPKEIASPWARFYGTSVHAIILLGRLGDVEILDDLFGIISDKGKKFISRYGHDDTFKKRGCSERAVFEFACAAVIKIADCLPNSEKINIYSKLMTVVSNTFCDCDNELQQSAKIVLSKLEALIGQI